MYQRRISGHCLLLLGLFAFAQPTHCQTAPDSDLATLMAGSGAPLTLKLGGLDRTWRRLSASAPAEINSDPTSVYARLLSVYLAATEAYYTQGKTIKAGAETYLIAYHRPVKPEEILALLRVFSRTPPPTVPLTPDTELKLSLLNLRTVGSLNDVEPFDLQREINSNRHAGAEAGILNGGQYLPPSQAWAYEQRTVRMEGASVQSKSQASVNNLKQLSIGLMMYVEDYDENLPPMKDAATVKKALLPYAKNEQAFVQPETRRPYKPNASLSRRSLGSFNDPAKTIMFYEDAPDKDNTRAVAFMDGHVRRVPESQWSSLKRASHVPGP